MNSSSLVKRNNHGKTCYYMVWINDQGKRQSKSLQTDNKGAARQKQRDFESNLPASRAKVTGYTFENLSEDFTNWGVLHLRPQTLQTYRFSLQHAMNYWGAGTQIASITPSKVLSFQKHRSDKVSPSTVNGNTRDLKSAVNRAIKFQWYTGQNPFVGIDKLKTPDRPPQWLTVEQIEDIMQCAKADSRNAHLIFGLGIFAGLRKAEIDAAVWPWVDLDQGHIMLQNDVRTRNGGTEPRFLTKNRRIRLIPLHDQLRAILARHRQPDGYLIEPEKQDFGKYRYRFDIRATFDRVLKSAGNIDVTPHVMRHTFASLLAQSGKVSLFEIAELLGHADVKTTQIYAHLCPKSIDVNVFLKA